jgi:ppGpp synthetase/RelA/SpoT-type nucleotidyltranferase
MSRAAIDRLGVRLARHDQISSSDLNEFAQIIDVYQQVLDDVQAQLAAIGYQAVTRPKTTLTLVEKLRRETNMKLSRMQDVAGARIIVSDRPAQDSARDKICAHFETLGHTCGERDRRKNPSHGYRALHVIVQVGPVPVEIQIRTELENDWAQIFEKLGDRWGRGIRYGNAPADPEAEIRAGERVFSRREVITFLGEYSDVIADFETAHAVMIIEAQVQPLFRRLMFYTGQLREAQDQRSIADLPADERAMADFMATSLEATPLSEIQEALSEQPATTVARMFELVALGVEQLGAESLEIAEQLRRREQEIRSTLGLIASAAGV